MCELISLLFFKVTFWINCLEMNSVFFQKTVLRKHCRKNYLREKQQLDLSVANVYLYLLFLEDPLMKTSLKQSTIIFFVGFCGLCTGILFPLSVLSWMCSVVLLCWGSREDCLKGIFDHEFCHSETIVKTQCVQRTGFKFCIYFFYSEMLSPQDN